MGADLGKQGILAFDWRADVQPLVGVVIPAFEDVRLRQLRPELAVVAPAWRDYAELNSSQLTHLRDAIRDGARRRLARR